MDPDWLIVLLSVVPLAGLVSSSFFSSHISGFSVTSAVDETRHLVTQHFLCNKISFLRNVFLYFSVFVGIAAPIFDNCSVGHIFAKGGPSLVHWKFQSGYT